MFQSRTIAHRVARCMSACKLIRNACNVVLLFIICGMGEKKRSFRNCYVNKSKFNASYDEFDIIQREWHSGAETPTETIKNVTGNKLKATYILLSGTKLILRALTVIRLMNLHFD